MPRAAASPYRKLEDEDPDFGVCLRGPILVSRFHQRSNAEQAVPEGTTIRDGGLSAHVTAADAGNADRAALSGRGFERGTQCRPRNNNNTVHHHCEKPAQ